MERDLTSETVAGNGVATVVCCNLAFMTSLLRRAALVIGGDTGPIHVAAALDRPVLALFGPTAPARNGPYGVKCRVLRDADSVTDHGRYEQTEAGLLRISVEQVTAAAFAMLQEKLDG
jgi:heptosyltransferase-1